MSIQKRGVFLVVSPDQNAAESSLRNLANPRIDATYGNGR